MRRRLGLEAVALAAICVFGGDARAQAWLPDAGHIHTELTYNDLLNKKHYLPNGDEVDAGHTRIHSTNLSISYSPSDKLMLEVGLPYVRGEYHGPAPHPTPIDNSHFHGTLTDLHLAVHYQWLEDPLALAPYIALIQPVHDYPALGHAAPGRNLQELWTGFFIGRSLDLWLPRTYVQARYTYAFVEKVAGISHDRSNADLELGYFFSPAWSARALLMWQETHGGIDVPIPVTNPLFPYHDQLAADAFLNVGLGASWVPTGHTSTYVIYRTSLEGKNGHKLDQGLSLGFSYMFSVGAPAHHH
jgi:hypothetical protein